MFRGSHQSEDAEDHKHGIRLYAHLDAFKAAQGHNLLVAQWRRSYRKTPELDQSLAVPWKVLENRQTGEGQTGTGRRD